MSESRLPPRRTAVTSPRTRARRTPSSRPFRSEIDEQTRLGDIYMRSLVRAQLRLAVLTCSVFALLVGGLPLLFALAPATRTARLLGLPLPWLLLGVLVHPFLLLLGWLYLRAAERNERDFAELVDP